MAELPKRKHTLTYKLITEDNVHEDAVKHCKLQLHQPTQGLMSQDSSKPNPPTRQHSMSQDPPSIFKSNPSTRQPSVDIVDDADTINPEILEVEDSDVGDEDRLQKETDEQELRE